MLRSLSHRYQPSRQPPASWRFAYHASDSARPRRFPPACLHSQARSAEEPIPREFGGSSKSKVRPTLSSNTAPPAIPPRPRRLVASCRSTPAPEILKGGETGPAVVPGKPADSLLIKAVHHTGELKMPEKSKLPARVIADLVRWVELGAPAPEGKRRRSPPPRSTGQRPSSSGPSNRPPTRSARGEEPRLAAQPHRPLRSRSPGLEGMVPGINPPTATLLRRLTFDLTGLPPTPSEVEAFVNDARPDAGRA